MLLAWQNKSENHDAPQQILPAQADTSSSSPRVGWGCLPLLEGPWTADGKHSPSWNELQGENKTSAGEHQQCLAVTAASVTPPAHTASEQGEPGEAPPLQRCAASKGRNGARAREEKGHLSCNLTFWVCCLRKQWKCCNVCNASLARLFLSFFSASGLAFFSNLLKTNLKNQQLPSPNTNLTICSHFCPCFYKLLFTMQRGITSVPHVSRPLSQYNSMHFTLPHKISRNSPKTSVFSHLFAVPRADKLLSKQFNSPLTYAQHTCTECIAMPSPQNRLRAPKLTKRQNNLKQKHKSFFYPFCLQRMQTTTVAVWISPWVCVLPLAPCTAPWCHLGWICLPILVQPQLALPYSCSTQILSSASLFISQSLPTRSCTTFHILPCTLVSLPLLPGAKPFPADWRRPHWKHRAENITAGGFLQGEPNKTQTLPNNCYLQLK